MYAYYTYERGSTACFEEFAVIIVQQIFKYVKRVFSALTLSQVRRLICLSRRGTWVTFLYSLQLHAFVFSTGCYVFYSYSVIRFYNPFCGCPVVGSEFAITSVFCYSCFQTTLSFVSFVFDLYKLYANCLEFDCCLQLVNTVQAFTFFILFFQFVFPCSKCMV